MTTKSTFKRGETERIEGWFTDGKKMLETYACNGELHGKYLLFHENGEPMLEGEWQNGYPDGVTRVYYRNGQLKQEVHFNRGQFHGAWREWDSRGRLVMNALFENGSPMGGVSSDVRKQPANPIEPTILLADDDPSVRAVYAAALEDDGYVVTQASNGAKALDLIIKGGKFSFLVTDYDMPEMTGGELLKKVFALGYAFRAIIIISALPPSDTELLRLRREFAHQLSVSFARKEDFETVLSILQQGGPSL